MDQDTSLDPVVQGAPIIAPDEEVILRLGGIRLALVWQRVTQRHVELALAERPRSGRRWIMRSFLGRRTVNRAYDCCCHAWHEHALPTLQTWGREQRLRRLPTGSAVDLKPGHGVFMGEVTPWVAD